jgi:hypothetical protein
MRKGSMARETQIEKIIRTADEVSFASAKEADQMAFMSKCFIQATLPHSDPGDVPLWGRRNGNYSLTIQPHFVFDEEGKPKSLGIPYGSIPRLILAWTNAEVVKTKSQELILGKSLADFMEKIGFDSATGGKNGSITRLKTQSMRLFSSTVSLTYQGEEGIDISNALLAKRSVFFWDAKQPSQQALWESKVVLSDEFFKILAEAPVPLDWRVLKALKQSPMALDLYVWLSYRMYSLRKPQKIRWEALATQFGSEYKSVRHFKSKVREHFRKIYSIWNTLNVDFSCEDGVELRPSPLLIKPN